MGPITGIRIINLRVRKKVAYPDLTLDLAGDDAAHLVVGLENGGGKSTLLGAAYHVFVPEAEQFLPRRAQKRQQKRGEVKRLEHYVPGGDPTHFIVEVEAPTGHGSLPFLTGSRILVGACLWKPPGSSESVAASEFFWSARCVAPELALREFRLRGPGGRLFDPREFRAALKQLRDDVPAAQVSLEEGKAAWQAHLRNLGVDVDYVRQFLLRMNEDEGAADQVFTYASSRDFLNSLVGVVGNAESIAKLKERLVETATDADGMRLDRQRATLLEALLSCTGPLAESLRELETRVQARERTLDQVLAAGARTARGAAAASAAAERLRARTAKLESEVAEARSAAGDASARVIRAKLQVASLRLRDASRALEATRGELAGARRAERISRASALLVQRRGSEVRIRELERVLGEKELAAEPLRAELSSAVQALSHRLEADIGRLEVDRERLTRSIQEAEEEVRSARADLERAGRRLGTLDGERSVLMRDQASASGRLTAGVDAGLLAHVGADPRTEADRARDAAAGETALAEEIERERASANDEVTSLSTRSSALAVAAVEATHAITTAEAALADAATRTSTLEADLASSGFIEVDPIVLTEHVASFVDRLVSAAEAARRRQAVAAVVVATADRAAGWLRDRHLLPPRADVERLGDRALARRLGARSGWSYLATLPEDVAAAHAAAHPGLADGLVVNVPEDLEAVVALVVAARSEIEAPIAVGMAAAFDVPRTESQVTIVLPDDAHWSTAAGQALADAYTAASDRSRADYENAVAKGELASRLHDRVVAWNVDIGTEGLESLRRYLAQAKDDAAAIENERAEVDGQLAASRAAGAAAEVARDSARGRAHSHIVRAEKLDALAVDAARLLDIEKRLYGIAAEKQEAAEASAAAETATGRAERRREEAGKAKEKLAEYFGDLRSRREELVALIEVAVRAGDPIAAADAGGDRLLLARQVQDRDRRWRGAVTDPELRAALDATRLEIAEHENRIEEYVDVVEDARMAVAGDTTRSAEDYRGEAEQGRILVERLAGADGELRQLVAQRERERAELERELQTVRRPADLASADRTEDLGAAEKICERLVVEREQAQKARTAKENEKAQVEKALELTKSWTAQLESATRSLKAAARTLAAGGSLVPSVEIVEREGEIDVLAVVGATELPESVLTLLDIASRPVADDDTEAALAARRSDLEACLDQIQKDADSQRRCLSDVESRADRGLDATESLLRGAPDDVVRGDQLIQNLRLAPRVRLASLVGPHHRDIGERLVAVRHHVATFDARLDSLSETAYAAIAEILREVRRTVRDSQLPNTPAMGRWAGLDLLKMSGMDSLGIEGRRTAIAVTLRGWFDPDNPDGRPRRLDGDEVVHDLLRAATPQFSARILIPSDPLDPEHKPVDHLALETSGGEGVTVALILASLLASRRASARGHGRTTLMLDNPFAKVTKPGFLRLARDIADELHVQIVAFTGIRDIAALSVFPRLAQLRVSRRENANFVVPSTIADERLQSLLRGGTLYVSPIERDAASEGEGGDPWPVMSMVTIAERRTPTEST